LLNDHSLAQALKKLRTSELKPYIIYVKAPPFDRLAETRTRAFARSTFAENGASRAFTVSPFENEGKIELKIALAG